MAYRLLVSTNPATYLRVGPGRGFLAWIDPAVADFRALTRLPTAVVYAAAILNPRDPDTGQERSFYVTSAPRLHTGSEDKPPNSQFLARALAGWTFSRRAAASGELLGRSSVSVGGLAIDDSDGLLSDWRGLDWSGAKCDLRLGGRTRASGGAYPWSSYRPVFPSVVIGIEPRDGGGWDVRLRGLRRQLASPVVEERYRGFGGALRIPDNSWATPFWADTAPTGVPTLPVPGPLSVSFVGVIESLPASYGSLFRLGTALGLRVSSTGALRFHVGAGAVNAPDLLPEGSPIAVVATLAADGKTAKLMVGTSDQDLEVVAEGVFPVAFTGAGLPYLGQHDEAGALTEMDLSAWEVVLYNTELSLEDAIEAVAKPVSDPLNDSTVVEAWKFEEGTGASALGSKGLVNLSMLGSCSFAASLEGDDPDSFDGGPIGKTKPDCWGPCNNVLLTWVDSQRGVLQWSRGPSADLKAVRVDGARMVPDETITAAANGDFLFDAATRSINLSPGYSAHRFVPGQASPAVTGQRIEVKGSEFSDGTYTIRAAGVSKNGRVIRVAEEIASGSCGGGCTIATLPADVQFTYDLATSTITTPQPPEGAVTADVAGRVFASGKCLVSEWVKDRLDADVDTADFEWDPEVGIWIPPGSSPNQDVILDQVVASAFAWLIETREGSYRLVTVRLPSGTPVKRFTATSTMTLREVATLTPWSQISATHSKTWHEQKGDLAGSVPPALRDLYSQPWRILPKTVAGVAKKYPLAIPRPDPFETYLTREKDARRFLKLAAPVVASKRRWLECVVAGFGISTLDANDVVSVQDSDPILDLQEPTLARILSVSEGTDQPSTSLEIFL